MNTKYRQKILDLTKKYRDELDKIDFSHDSNHIFRVESMAKVISRDEGADLEVIEAACLIFDIARDLEDKGKIEDHAEEGVKIARKILEEISFPKDKINNVCHAIFVHRRSKDRIPETLEAKILRDADYLDAMGAVDIVRVISSSLQSKKYKRPIYIDREYRGDQDNNASAIDFLTYQLKSEKHQPKFFYTKLGRKIAEGRYKFMQEFRDRFVDEWHGKR